MTDELERLESALRANPPRATDADRERAIAAAMASFDRRYQGIPGPARHTKQTQMRRTSWIRRLAMPTSRPSLAIAGIAGFALLAGVVAHLTSVAPPPPPSPVTDFYRAMPSSVGPADAEPTIAERTIAILSRERAANAPVDREPAAPPEAADQFHFLHLVDATSRTREQATPEHDRNQGGDRFADVAPNPVKVVAEEPVSTFSIDVDTASYGFVRASLNRGVLPPADAVRVEELVNYFPYDYAGPASRETPFAASVSLAPAPWNDETRLMHIGIKGYLLDAGPTPRANLVFLVDVSGSMGAPDKLPLLVNSLKLLLGTLAPEDTVAIVVYAGAAGMVLAPTPIAERAKIRAALERLDAGGSTGGAEGIRQAYALAEQHFVEGGVNRVILATDGDFNVGMTEPGALESYIARKRESGVFLSVLGFGMGNYHDELMQRLAQHGNGNAAYIDSLSEARKALVEEATSMLFPIAKDVKIQVEFNPAAISEYRLIGYETRMLAREDFRNDRVDAGDIGSGHTVTALYEVALAGSGAERIAPLRYRSDDDPATLPGGDGELAFLKIRYKQPDADTSAVITRAVTATDVSDDLESASREVRFAAAVAGFGQLLRGGRYTGDYGYDDVIALAQDARGEDPFGYRAEFINLVRLAKSAAAIEPLRP